MLLKKHLLLRVREQVIPCSRIFFAGEPPKTGDKKFLHPNLFQPAKPIAIWPNAWWYATLIKNQESGFIISFQMLMTLEQKTENIKLLIREMDRVLVAFSGGVDSTLVLALSHEVLGDKVLGVTAQSTSVPAREIQASHQLAREIGANHRVIRTDEVSNPNYQANPANRCYHCKKELYSSLKKIARQENITHIVNGTNTDDLGDYRPGLESAREQGVRSPLVEAEFSKQDVRELSKLMKLSIWNKPAMACLSSRVPYGQPVTPEKLSMIEKAEDLLFSLGFAQLRVRHHGELASIELDKKEMPLYLNNEKIQKIVQENFKGLGFSTVTLDPEGYRMGSLNATLEKKQ